MNPQALAIILSIVFLISVLLLLRFYFLPEKYAVIWLVAAAVSVVLSFFPQILAAVADFFGIAQPINLLFFSAFFVVLLLLMQLSLELARTRDELRRVVQRVAVDLEEKAQREPSEPRKHDESGDPK
ncbi:DUF2304 domain-containing protein [Lysinimonas soli]|uniref:DUF2304 domain-containing protein n=1 Tax=Lysinimonas soli TaxID=1074233 RepID=A0ABW0NV26_9MICO